MCFRLLLCICGTLVVFLSCSEDENDTLETLPLSFAVRTENETRAFTDSYGNYTGNEFGVNAKLYRPEYNASNTQGQPFMVNEKVTYDGNVCETEKSYYWDNGDIHFAAYSPYTSELEEETLKLTLPATPYAGYRYEGVVDGYTDYMFADEQLGDYKDFTNGCVPINFRHALAKIDFSVMLSNNQVGTTAWSLDLLSLKLVNIRNEGYVSFTHESGAVNSWQSNEDEVWNIEDDDSFCEMTVTNSTMHIDDISEHNINNSLYLMPQRLYGNGESQYVQSLVVEYILYKTRGGITESEEYSVILPLRSASITKWGINKNITYRLVLEPGGSVELVADVQPWEYVEIENEFSNTVGMDNGELLDWIDGTFQNDDEQQNILTMLPDITQPAQFTFRIGSPLGSTWYAMLRTKKGNPSAFSFVAESGSNATITDGVALGAVGDRVTLKVVANDPNPTETNEAELIFVVICNGKILTADVVVGTDQTNYIIRQNINI